MTRSHAEELIIFSSSFTACPLDNRPFGSLRQRWHSFDLRPCRLSGGRNQLQFGHYRPSHSHCIPVRRKPFRLGKLPAKISKECVLEIHTQWPSFYRVFLPTFYQLLEEIARCLELEFPCWNIKTQGLCRSNFFSWCIMSAVLISNLQKVVCSVCVVREKWRHTSKVSETHYDKWLRFNLFFSASLPYMQQLAAGVEVHYVYKQA